MSCRLKTRNAIRELQIRARSPSLKYLVALPVERSLARSVEGGRTWRDLIVQMLLVGKCEARRHNDSDDFKYLPLSLSRLPPRPTRRPAGHILNTAEKFYLLPACNSGSAFWLHFMFKNNMTLLPPEPEEERTD